MIMEEQYLWVADIPCVTTQQVLEVHGKEATERWCKWVRGQTCMMGPDGKAAFYAWDYERWVQEGQDTKQHPETWD